MAAPSAPSSLSLDMGPAPSFARVFVKSQFCTKTKRVALSPETSLTGKTVLVTGASTGLGYHACRHFLSLNLSRLILAVRSVAKGERVAQEFRAKYPNATIEVWELEMSDYDSVIGFSKRVAAKFDNNSSAVEAEPKEHQQRKKARLDIAILNAGMTGATFTRDKKTGHCEVVQVNYLSTVLLSVLLMPVMRDEAGGNPGRLCIVGSGASHMAKLPNRHKRPFLASFDDPAVQPWEPAERYFASKALGMLFFVRLIDYLPSPDELVVNLVDPGYCKGTDLHRDAKGLMRIMLSATKELTGRPLEDGAWTYVDAAVVKGKESHGCFVMDWDIRPFINVVYEPEGQGLLDALFEETVDELSFAGVRKILHDMKRKRTA